MYLFIFIYNLFKRRGVDVLSGDNALVILDGKELKV